MIEMAYLMPVVLMVWALVIFALFYYHDKNIIAGAAYETAVLGSELMHEKKEPKSGELENYFQERIGRKLLFYRGATVEITCDNEKVRVSARACSFRMCLSVERRMAVTAPEEKIRGKRALKNKVEDIVQ